MNSSPNPLVQMSVGHKAQESKVRLTRVLGRPCHLHGGHGTTGARVALSFSQISCFTEHQLLNLETKILFILKITLKLT